MALGTVYIAGYIWRIVRKMQLADISSAVTDHDRVKAWPREARYASAFMIDSCVWSHHASCIKNVFVLKSWRKTIPVNVRQF